MKKRLFALVFACILLIYSFCVGVSAQGDEEPVILDNSVFYIDIPEGYMFDTEQSDNFYIIDSDFGNQTLEFFVQGNLMFPKGVSKADDDEIISKVKRITQWSNTFSVSNVETQVINGQKAVVIKGTDEFLFETVVEYYVFNTKEAVCVVGTTYSTDEEMQEIQQIMNTFVMNGTYFEGDAPIRKHDFSNSTDYYEAVKANAEAYYEYYEEFDDGMWSVVGVVGIIILIIPCIVIALVVLIVYCSKYKKLVKEYEGYFGPIYAVRSNIMAQRAQQGGYGYNNPYAQPLNTQPQGYVPQAQPYQPQAVPQQPPVQIPPQQPVQAPQNNTQPSTAGPADGENNN